MLKLLNKVSSDKYEILDTSDNTIEKCSSRVIINAVVNHNIAIDGVYIISDATISFTNLGLVFKKQLVGNKFRIYPNKEQRIMIAKCLGCKRFIYNKMLGERIEFYKSTGESLDNHYNDYTNDYKFLKEVPQRILQLAERDLNKAYKNFFRRVEKGESNVGFPRFKSKHSTKQRFQIYNDSNCIRIDSTNKHIVVPKMGNIKIKFHKKITGRITTITIEKTPTDKYYMSMNTEEYVSYYEKHSNKVVGIDLGIKDLAILDNGTVLPNDEVLDKYLDRLRVLQQKFSRTEKGSKNREKLRRKIARVHERIRNIRTDNIHKFTRKMIDENQVIITEDLNIRGMMSNKTHTKKKRTRSRRIANASWYEFTRQFEYKSEWRNNTYQKIGRNYPSTQLCHVCEYKNTQLKGNTSIREWVCPKCGTKHDRDVNSANNIKQEGIRILGIA